MAEKKPLVLNADGTKEQLQDGDWLNVAPLSGWISLGTCTYETADSPTFQFSIASDVTGLLSVGMRIKLTQTTVKYFLITAVGAYSAGKTIITVYGGTDFTLANAAITSPCYSLQKAPFGFPLTEDKWTVTLADTTNRSQSSPTANTVYNMLSQSVPIGSWIPSLHCVLGATKLAATVAVIVTLATTNSSVNGNFLTKITGYNDLAQPIDIRGAVITLNSKTTYYINIYATLTSITTIFLDNANSALFLRFVSAYL